MFAISHEPLTHGETHPLGVLNTTQLHPSIIPLKDGGLLNTRLYCMCKGLIQQEIMVGCEMGEEKCVNGGWVHP